MKRPGDLSVRCTLLLMLDYQVRALTPRHRPAPPIPPSIPPPIPFSWLGWALACKLLCPERPRSPLHPACSRSLFPRSPGPAAPEFRAPPAVFLSHFLTASLVQPPQFKLDPRLARLLGLHTQSRSAIVQALWQYVKTNRLQDSHDKEYINGDKYFQQVPSPRAWGHGEGKGLCSGTPPCLLDSTGNDLRAGDPASHLGSATTPPCAAACPSQPPHPRGEEGREPQKASGSGEHVLGTWS